ncbi:MAG: hypothetical protein ABEN55_19650, partial [Bradymonadaceae bacterium]
MASLCDRRTPPWTSLLVVCAAIVLGTTGCSFDSTVGGGVSPSLTDTGTVDGRADDTGELSVDTSRADTTVSPADTGSSEGDTAGCPGGAGCDTGSARDTSDTRTVRDTADDTSSGRDTTPSEDTAPARDTANPGDGCTGNGCGTNPTDPGIDLTGRWIAKGYSCRGSKPIQVIDIQHANSTIVATKRVGDNCVGAGNTTFSARNVPTLRAGDTVTIELQTTTTSFTDTLAIQSRDTITIPQRGIELARADTSNVTTNDLTGTWKTLDYQCNVNPSGEATVKTKGGKL